MTSAGFEPQCTIKYLHRNGTWSSVPETINDVDARIGALEEKQELQASRIAALEELQASRIAALEERLKAVAVIDDKVSGAPVLEAKRNKKAPLTSLDLQKYADESDILLILYDDGARAWIGCNHVRIRYRECQINKWLVPRTSTVYDAYETLLEDEKLILRLAPSTASVLDPYEYLFEHFVKRCSWSQVGTTFPASHVGTTFPASHVGTTFPASQVGTTFPASQVGTTFPASHVGTFPPLDSIDLVVGVHSSPSLLIHPCGQNQTTYEPEISQEEVPMVFDNMCLFSRNLLWRNLILGDDD
jgi:hypothetical protein